MADQSIDTKFATDPVVTPAATDRMMVTQAGVTRVETRAQLHALESGEILSTDTIDESTPAAGVTVDGLLLKDGEVIMADAAGPTILDEAATATNPTLIPNKADPDTGVGWAAADQLSLIAGGTEIARLVQVGGLTDQLILAPAGGSVGSAAATPTLAFGNGDSGFYENADDVIYISIGGAAKWRFTTSQFGGIAGNRPSLIDGNPTSTSPNIIPELNDPDTGIGHTDADALSLISGAQEAIRYTEVSSHIIQKHEAQVGITANSNSSQGDTPLLSTYNVISVVVTAGHAVTLPAVFGVGTVIYVKNDDAAESADIFPASGDDAGAGANTAVALAAGVGTLFLATVANATWTQMF